MERAEFIPFVPPRWQPPSRSLPSDQCIAPAPEQSETAPAANVEYDEPQPRAEVVAEQVVPQASFDSRLLESGLSLEMRSQATRYASIAVGRLLRHAVAFDPAVIARFVDDAIDAASDARARVTTSGVGMQPGDVVVEIPGGSVSASLETRAELMVEAIAARERLRDPR